MDFKSSLLSLKNALAKLDVDDSNLNDTTQNKSQPVVKAKVPDEERIAKKIEDLLKEQKEKIVINAGGKVFYLTKSTINNTKYYNVFQDLIKLEENQKEIFYDCSSKEIKHIFNLMRALNFDNNNSFSKENKYKLVVSNGSDIEVVQELIKKVFFIDYEAILETVKIIKKSSLDDIPQTTPVINTVPITNNYDYGNPGYDDQRANRNYDGGYY